MQTLSLIRLMAAVLPLGVHAASGNGKSTRYWDCCKPSCAWSGKASVSRPVLTCDKNDQPISDANTKSGCESGGSAYTCTNQSPWAINDLVSYGFAATAINGGSEASWCCACYALTFTSGKAKGKIMLVQSVNTGSDLADNQFDLQIPGGGTGIFDGCTSQFGGIAGAQYGGISDRSECSSMPSKLQAGCQWRFDWFKNADNPTFSFTQIQCPDELTSRSGCKRTDDSSFPKYTMPSATTWQAPQPTATAAAFAQCDSLIWDVAMACPAGYYCSKVTDYYWQCVQGSSSPSTSTSSSSGTTSMPTTTATGGSGSGTAAHYAQCGGIGYSGPTACESPYTCVKSNDYYSQCL